MGWSLSKALSEPGSLGIDGFNGWDYVPGVGDARAQDKANKENIKQAELNRQFQERMSNTAYQRGMADMSAAGLNPTLAFSQGGASSPSGSQATVQSASKTGLADKALQAYTGMSMARNQTNATQSQMAVNESSIKLQAANAAKAVADANNTNVETKIREKELPRAQLEKELSEKATEATRYAAGILNNSAKSIVPKGYVDSKTLQYKSPTRASIEHIGNQWSAPFKKAYNYLKGK